MKLPHIFTNERDAHLIILVLSAVNTLLIVVIFFILSPTAKNRLLGLNIIPIAKNTPVIRFDLISPTLGSTVSGTVPLVTTLSNGPKITSAELFVDNQRVQALTSKQTEKLTIYWDTTKHPDGKHNIQIQVADDQSMLSSLTTSLSVKNNVYRNTSAR